MAVHYKLYRINDNINKEKPKVGYAPRVVSKGTYELEDLAKQISHASSFTEGDIYGILRELSNSITSLLTEGYNVNINDLGTFYISAESPVVESEQDIRAGSVKFKRLIFRPSVKINRKLQKIKFERG